MKIFEAKIFKENKRVYVNLKGKIDTRTVNEFKEVLEKAKREGEKEIVINYRDIDYVSSAGYGALLKFCVYSKKDNINVIVTGMKPEIKSIFDIMELHRFIDYREKYDIPEFEEKIEEKAEETFNLENWIEEKIIENPLIEPSELIKECPSKNKISEKEFKEILKKKGLLTREERLFFAYKKLKEKLK
ncbi:MAG: STAS domain-containing protein [candidate division WOR-3 bacterium]